VTTPAARALLADVIDYGGLFPPAALGMEQAVAAYARYRRGPEAWMLGRFIAPAARLDELEAAWRSSRTPEVESGPWRLSSLVGPALQHHADLVTAFNARNEGSATIDTVEVTASTPPQLTSALDVLPPGLAVFVEIPLPAAERDRLLPILKARRARAKIRTGGVTPDTIPDPALVAGFLAACAAADVPFKATAGLHHAVRAERPLTYAPDGPRATMHGFLNVLVAAAFARAGMRADDLAVVLREERPEAFAFDEQGLTWQGRRLRTEDLAATRAGLALGFGSCSFMEPVADVRSLGLIP